MTSSPEIQALGEAYVALQAGGMTVSAIAKQHGVSKNSVCGLLWRTKNRTLRMDGRIT